MRWLALGAAFTGVAIIVSSGPGDPTQAAADRRAPSSASTSGAQNPASGAMNSASVVRGLSLVAEGKHSAAPADYEALTDVVQRYCVVCHNDRMLTGNLTLSDFDVPAAPDKAETAERMIRKLRAGMMPPPGMPRPGGDTLMLLAQTIESLVDEAARANPNLGTRRFPRLSRREYEREVHELLGLDIDAGRWLPADILSGSFDNMSASQILSTTLLDSYLRAATDVARLAVGNVDAVSITAKYTNPREVSQHAWDRIEGAPFGTRGGMVVTHHFPADGEYVFKVATRFGVGNPRAVSSEDIDISIDGEPVAVLMLPHNNSALVSSIETEPIFVRAGQRQISAAFVNLVEGPYQDRFQPPTWSASGLGGAGYGVTGLSHLTELMITGPSRISGVSDTDSRAKVFSCRPASAADAPACAESILRRLANQAYRRPVTAERLASLMAFYGEGAAVGGFELGVRTGLQAILASPEFLFRLEREPAGLPAGQAYRLTDLDLASRLSFFLWASGPDQELRDVAARGRLSEPQVLEQQVRRMLGDPRAEALATRFAHQWLRLQDVGKVWPEPFLYPSFSRQLADDMVRETQLFFHQLVQEDASLLELFSADYTFLNGRLARHYGIEGVTGEEFRRVQYPNEQRRGVLGHGSVLHLTSMSDRTSPVIRGKWVMEVLMGTPPPPPPPNVPVLDATPGASDGRRLTTRARMEAHRASPMCNSCHQFIDPIGLALDNFDVTGRWRTRENMEVLDTRGDFYDGTPITSPPELVDVLLKRPVPLARNFAEHLLAYAIGRPTTHSDQPTVRAITNAAAADGYALSSLILGVVMSDSFQMRLSQTTSDDGR